MLPKVRVCVFRDALLSGSSRGDLSPNDESVQALVSQRTRSHNPSSRSVIRGRIFSLEESLESLKSLDSLESLEHGRILLCFPQSGGSLKSLESLNSLENGLF